MEHPIKNYSESVKRPIEIHVKSIVIGHGNTSSVTTLKTLPFNCSRNSLILVFFIGVLMSSIIPILSSLIIVHFYLDAILFLILFGK